MREEKGRRGDGGFRQNQVSCVSFPGLKLLLFPCTFSFLLSSLSLSLFSSEIILSYHSQALEEGLTLLLASLHQDSGC